MDEGWRMGNRKKGRRPAAGSDAIANVVAPGEPQATMAPGEPQATMVPGEPQPIVVHPQVHGFAAGAEIPRAHMLSPARQAAGPGTYPPAPVVTSVRGGRSKRQQGAYPGTPGGQSPAPPELTTGEPKRAFSLDALRGLFLVLMTIGFTVRGDLFPLWMYHRQMPPPDFTMVDVPGIAWRDLTYVAFLFTMAAALPITLSRRIDKGEVELAIIFNAVRRFLLLIVFALLIGHSNTYFTGYTQLARMIAIAGFVIMALVFTRPKPTWNPALWKGLNLLGWGLTVAFLVVTPLLYDETFRFTRIDDIISGLAFAALAGSITWYFTRNNLTARLGVMAAVAALYLGSRNTGWLQDWWWSSPVPWAIAPSRLSLLLIVIPGTIAGDAILRWVRSSDTTDSGQAGWGRVRLAAIGVLAFAFAPVFTAGMYTREVLLTTQVVAAMVIGGAFLVTQPRTALERMIRSLFLWGSVWILLGLFVEPAEGGIRKTPETMAYFLGVTGVSVMLLAALTVVVDALRGRRWVSALIDVGHNPMLAYVLFTVLLNSLFELIEPLRGVLRQSAGEILLRMLLETLLVVLIVRFVTRRRIYWRT
jgi:predicted acyltransferase